MSLKIELGKIYKISYLDHSTGEYHGGNYEEIKLWKFVDIGKVILVKDGHVVLANSWGKNESEETVTKYICILRSAILKAEELK